MPKIHQLTDFDHTGSQSWSSSASVLTHGHSVFAEDEGTPGCYIFDPVSGETDFCTLIDTRKSDDDTVLYWVFMPKGSHERKFVIFNR